MARAMITPSPTIVARARSLIPWISVLIVGCARGPTRGIATARPAQPPAPTAAASRAPSSTPPRPVEHLAPIWQRRDVDLGPVLHRGIVLNRGGRAVVVSPLNGEELGRSGPAGTPAPGGALSTTTLETRGVPCPDRPHCTTAVGHLCFGPTGDGTCARRVDLGVGLWTLAIIAHAPSDLFVAHSTTSTRAFDASGRERWRFANPNNTPEDWFAADPRFFVRVGEQTAAVDMDRGGVTWRTVGEPVAADRRHVVTWTRVRDVRTLRVHDAATGRSITTFAAAEWPAQSVLVGDVLLTREFDGTTTARDLRDGTVLWRRTRVRNVVAADDAVFVADDRWILRALAPTTGEVRWAYAIACAIEGGLSGPSMAVLRDLDGGDGLVVGTTVLCGAGTAAFARAATPPVRLATTVVGTVRVDGRPAADVGVYVGEVDARTDAVGRYRAVVSIPGALRVRPSQEDIFRTFVPVRQFDVQYHLVGFADTPIEIDGRASEVEVSFDLRIQTNHMR
jgi:hypothetical protein